MTGPGDNWAQEGQSTLTRVSVARLANRREKPRLGIGGLAGLVERTPLPCWRRMSEAAFGIGRAAISSACGNERASRCWRRSTRKASRRPAKNGTRHVTWLWDSTPFPPLLPDDRQNQFTESRRRRVSTPRGRRGIFQFSRQRLTSILHAAPYGTVDFHKRSMSSFRLQFLKRQRGDFRGSRRLSSCTYDRWTFAHLLGSVEGLIFIDNLSLEFLKESEDAKIKG